MQKKRDSSETATSYPLANEVFKENLSHIMKKRGYTQDRLERIIKDRYNRRIYTNTISRQTISLYTRGESAPAADILYILCHALDVSADFLLGFSKAERPYEGANRLVERYKALFDTLLAAEDEAHSNGEFLQLFDLINNYIFQKRPEGAFTIGNDGSVKYRSREDLEREKGEVKNDKNVFQTEYESEPSADEILSQFYLKNIEKALNNLREYALTH